MLADSPILLLTAFACALALALGLVPLLARQACRLGFVDQPEARKVHTCALPRVGGVAIFISFYLTLILLYLFFPKVLEPYVIDPRNVFLILGSLVAFGVGVTDDFKDLRARHKFFCHIVAAGLAYVGGIRIETFGFYDLFQLDLGWLSPVVTIFWMVLIINAFNLIDGLDGLAGGIGIIACIFLGYVCFLRGNFGGLVFMVAIAGSLLGFLRYNFHPATVFLGDGGSYFIGYLLGVVSTSLAMSNSATMTTLIPMLVVALPVIEVSMATLRRFLRGKGIFTPDKQHFHHMLLNKGLTHRGAVLTLYLVTLIIGGCALAFLRIKDENAYLLLLVFGLCILYGIAKLGYLKDYDLKTIRPWLYSIGDEIGLSRNRRRFLDIQLKISSARDLPELWHQVAEALIMLEFTIGAVYLRPGGRHRKTKAKDQQADSHERRTIPVLTATVAMRQHAPEWQWHNPLQVIDQQERSLFRVEMDLQSADGFTYGTLLLIKNQKPDSLSHYSLKRIEQLKRSIVKALMMIEQEKKLPHHTPHPIPAMQPLLVEGRDDKLKN